MMNCKTNHAASSRRVHRPENGSARECALMTAWVSFAPLAILGMFLLTQLH